MEFWEWFDSIRGDTSIRHIEVKARCPRGRIGNAYRKRQPTQEIAQSIADGLQLHPIDVFRRARMLPPTSAELRRSDPDLDRACASLFNLPEHDRQVIYRIVAGLAQQRLDAEQRRDARELLQIMADMPEDELLELNREIRRLLEERGAGDTEETDGGEL